MKITKSDRNKPYKKNIFCCQAGIVFCLFLVGCTTTNLYAQDRNIDSPGTDTPSLDSMKVYTYVQVKPRFSGDINKFIAANIQYPDSAKKNNIQGTVFVSCIIEKNGSISNITIMRSPDKSLSNEAKRVISTMPNWTPGQQNGKLVRVQYLIPVHFKLQ